MAGGAQARKRRSPRPKRSLTDAERAERAAAPSRLSAKYHPFYEGKIEVVSKVPIRSLDDLSIWYSPGVAAPCLRIVRRPELVYDLTNKWNTVAIVTDGSRILGLGNIGPKAGLPVMEGKSLLFKFLGGVDAHPLCLGTQDPDQIVQAVQWLAPSYGGINLEDIANPKCFVILERLRELLDIPIWHDDQQGTATIVTAAALNALKLVGKKPRYVSTALVGAGAANVAIARLLMAAGFKAKQMAVVDSKGILTRERAWEFELSHPDKYELCLATNAGQRQGGISEALRGADLVVAASRPGPGIITREMVGSMADQPIVFATANPIPEIWPWEAKEAGAAIVATGRSDFPNQVNNSLGFPGIFRGTLDVRAKTISDGMCLAAAAELGRIAEENGLDEEHIVPSMEDWRVFPREAVAVGLQAQREGLARRRRSRQELGERAEGIIRRARRQAGLLMARGIVRRPPH